MSATAIGREILRSYACGVEREWLVTNGLGGFAAGTVAGPNTRRYHGLLVASLRPPVERWVLVAGCGVEAEYRGKRYPLSSHEYGEGQAHPDGWRYLDGFRLEGSIPVWTWRLADAVLEQRVWMEHGRNTTYVAWRQTAGGSPVSLALSPLCTGRDYHWHSRGARDVAVETVPGGISLSGWGNAPGFRILAPAADCRPDPDWFWNFLHRTEAERGLDAHEDLFRPAVFGLALGAGVEGALVLTAEADAPRPASEALADERQRLAALDAAAGLAASTPDWVRQLVPAADQFIVRRRLGGTDGSSVIAGYPWFSDWGRDTMIALPGLALHTGRRDDARDILRTFAGFVSEGMLPNRFPDAGEAPEYNTVDATLWYFAAADEYLRRHPDPGLRSELYPVLTDIARWHLRGTRYGIRVDPADGLLRAGEPGVQLTWMDAKVGDWVVTPRAGKPVEINALWINALRVLAELAAASGDADAARDWTGRADAASVAFRARFWNEELGCLHDVVDVPDDAPGGGRAADPALRPNQILAVSLRHSPLTAEQARSVVDVCARELWTPLGLRSLAPSDPAYVGVYRGGPRERDGAYHQGTVWSWLLGPFATAHYRVHGDRPAALAWLAGIAAHLRDGCIGQVSEIFDGDPPYVPRGCFAQAWGVAEVLRAWSEINDSSNEAADGGAGDRLATA